MEPLTQLAIETYPVHGRIRQNARGLGIEAIHNFVKKVAKTRLQSLRGLYKLLSKVIWKSCVR